MMKILLILVFCLFSTIVWASVDFDGTDDGIDFGDTTLYDGATEMTIYVKFQFDTLKTTNRIISKFGDDYTNRSFLITSNFNAGSEDEIDLFFQTNIDADGNRYYATSTNANLSADTWYSLIAACEFNGTSSCVLYINSSTPSLTVSQSVGGSIRNVAAKMWLGRDAVTSTAYGDPLVSEFAIWEKQLTANEASQIINSKLRYIPLQIRPSSLKQYAMLDDQADGTSGDGDTFVDLVSRVNGTGNDGANNTGLTMVAEQVLSYSESEN